MASSIPRLTVRVIDELPRLKVLVDEIVKSAICTFPDIKPSCDNISNEHFFVSQYEDVTVFIISLISTIFVLTFATINITKITKKYRWRTMYRRKIKKRFSVNTTYVPWNQESDSTVAAMYADIERNYVEPNPFISHPLGKIKEVNNDYEEVG